VAVERQRTVPAPSPGDSNLTKPQAAAAEAETCGLKEGRFGAPNAQPAQMAHESARNALNVKLCPVVLVCEGAGQGAEGSWRQDGA
jgi:hypothetical protein